MTLKFVLWVKIIATALIWATPMLVLPGKVFDDLGFPDPRPVMVFMRILGAAFLALLVGYWQGMQQLRAGRYPAGTVTVGLVSNGLACGFIVAYGLAGTYADWELLAPWFMWISAGLTGFVTFGLLFHRR
jgi:hypothetical protein